MRRLEGTCRKPKKTLESSKGQPPEAVLGCTKTKAGVKREQRKNPSANIIQSPMRQPLQCQHQHENMSKSGRRVGAEIRVEPRC